MSNVCGSFVKARKGSDEKQGSAPDTTKQQANVSEDEIAPTPEKKPSPVKTSSKLAMMKKKAEERHEGLKSKTLISPSKIKISPKKEPIASSSSSMTFTPREGTTAKTIKTSPKKPEVRKSSVYVTAEMFTVVHYI